VVLPVLGTPESFPLLLVVVHEHDQSRSALSEILIPPFGLLPLAPTTRTALG